MRHTTKDAPAADERADSDKARLLKLAATVVAATFVLVGIAGFAAGMLLLGLLLTPRRDRSARH